MVLTHIGQRSSTPHTHTHYMGMWTSFHARVYDLIDYGEEEGEEEAAYIFGYTYGSSKSTFINTYIA